MMESEKNLYPESRNLAYLLRYYKFSIITMYLSTPKHKSLVPSK